LKPVIHIRSTKTFTHLLQESLASSELLKCLVWRDILVRYKEASLGVLWALFRPALSVILLTYLFGVVAKLPSADAPYPLFVLAGILPWQLVVSVLQTSSTSFILNHELISKIYFPRIHLVLSNLLVNSVDLVVSLVVFLPILFFQVGFRWENLLLLFLLPLLFLLAFSVALLVSSLSIRIRDLVIAVPYLSQISLFLTPVGYSSDLIDGMGAFALYLNPLTGIIEGFRYALLGIHHPHLEGCLFLSVLTILSFLTAALFFFKKTDQVLSDVL